jgi:hypothetical protein
MEEKVNLQLWLHAQGGKSEDHQQWGTQTYMLYYATFKMSKVIYLGLEVV